MDVMEEQGRTHDWALDLEPLALPPDLPPVILRDGMDVRFLGVVGVLSWESASSGECGRAWSVETMDGSLLSGGGADL